MNVLAVLLEAITIVSLLIHTAIVLLLLVPVQNTRAKASSVGVAISSAGDLFLFLWFWRFLNVGRVGRNPIGVFWLFIFIPTGHRSTKDWAEEVTHKTFHTVNPIHQRFCDHPGSCLCLWLDENGPWPRTSTSTHLLQLKYAKCHQRHQDPG